MKGAPLLRAAALAFVPLAVGVGLTAAVAALDRVSFSLVALLPPESTPPLRDALAILATLAGIFGFFVAPGLLALRAFRVRSPHAVASALAAFVLSNALLSIAWLAAMSIVPGEGSRWCAYLTAGAVDAALLSLAIFTAPQAPALPSHPRREAWHELVLPALAIGATLVAGLLLFPGKLRVEALEGDATEVLGFGASLFGSGVPFWDIESGAWGFYPTFAFVAYPVFFSLAIGGICEAAVRLPAMLFLGVLMLAAVDLALRPALRPAGLDEPRLPSRRGLPPILASGFLALLVGAHYAGYHPFHGDLGCSPLEEWMVAGFAITAVLLARDAMPALGALAALLALQTFPSGLLFVGLLGLGGVLFGTRAERVAVVRTGLWLGALLVIYAVAFVALTTHQGTIEPILREWQAKYFTGRARFAGEQPARILGALGWFTLLSGGALVAMPAALFRGDRVARWLAASGGAWILFFLFSPAKNVHYFLPASFIPVVVALRLAASSGPACLRARIGPPALTAGALASIALSWPARVPPYTADRDFGRASVFLAPSLREAIDDSTVLYNFAEPLWKWRPGDGWTIGHHTWVVYARRPRDPGWVMAPAPQTKGGASATAGDPTFFVGRGERPRDDLQEISRSTQEDGVFATIWSTRGREDWRAWRDRSYPLRRDLSRFNFEMDVHPVSKGTP